MALTITLTKVDGNPVERIGRFKVVHRKVDVEDTYADGGHALTPQMFGLNYITKVMFPSGPFCSSDGDGDSAIVPNWDRLNAKLRFFESTTGAPSKLLEVATATNLDGYNGEIEVWGR